MSHDQNVFHAMLGKYVLKRVSFGSKDCTKELQLEGAYVLGQTSYFIPIQKSLSLKLMDLLLLIMVYGLTGDMGLTKYVQVMVLS